MSTALADPVMRDLAVFERRQDADQAREDRVADRAFEIATHLCTREPETVLDSIFDDHEREREWERVMRSLARTAIREKHHERAGLANELAELVWRTAKAVGQERAEKEETTT